MNWKNNTAGRRHAGLQTSSQHFRRRTKEYNAK